MISRYFKGEVPYPSVAASRTESDNAIQKLATETIASFSTLWDDYQFSKALEAAWALVSAVDKYIVENEPWSLGDKQDDNSRSRLATVLYTTAEALRIVTALAYPVLPDSTAKIWSQLGLGEIKKFQLQDLKWGQLQVGTKLGKVEPVFPRADKSTVEKMQTMEQQRNGAAAQTAPEKSAATAAANPGAKTASAAGAAEASASKLPAGVGAEAGRPASQSAAAPAEAAQAGTPATLPPGVPAPSTDIITIDDFAKIDLRVAQVKFAEKVKGADRLLRLEVDLGYETRQIVAGIALAYTPEQLIGRKIVIIANLAPRKLKGLESKGMLLAASLQDGAPVLASFLEEVPVGAKLK